MDGNFSLSDFATLANANNGSVGGNGLWFILLFFLIFGNGNGWNRGAGEFNSYATAASQQDILYSSKFSDLDNKVDRGFTNIGNGISDATFALNNAIVTGANNATAAAISEGRAIQTQLSNYQLSSQANIDAVRYDMATMTNAINSNINDKFAALEKNQMQAQINAQASQINALQLQSAVCGIPKVSTTAWGVYPYSSPCGGCGCGNV